MTVTNKVLITGGHMTPAMAVAVELKQRGWEIGYVGTRHTLEGDITASQESIAAKSAGLTFFPLIAGRLQRTFTIYTIPSILKVPIGFIHATLILFRFRPSIIVSFGGYIALPIVCMAYLMQIPVVVHEQTRVTGLTNKILVRLAKKICISWPDLVDHYPSGKTVVTGNPVRNEVFKPYTAFEISQDKSLLYITGGNQGAHQINLMVEESLEQLLAHFSIIHQCGSATKYQDFQRLSKKKNALPETLRRRYLPIKYIDPSHIGWVYDQTHLLFSRAGANTVYEAILTHTPALYLPLPWSGGGEQKKNALFVSTKNGAAIFDEGVLAGMTLVEQLLYVDRHRNEMKKELGKIATILPHDAAAKIADVVESLV